MRPLSFGPTTVVLTQKSIVKTLMEERFHTQSKDDVVSSVGDGVVGLESVSHRWGLLLTPEKFMLSKGRGTDTSVTDGVDLLGQK